MVYSFLKSYRENHYTITWYWGKELGNDLAICVPKINTLQSNVSARWLDHSS